MCGFGMSITVICSSCVINNHMYSDTNLGSKRPLSRYSPIQNYGVTKKPATLCEYRNRANDFSIGSSTI